MPKSLSKRKRVGDWTNEIMEAVRVAVYGKFVNEWRDKYGEKNLSQVTDGIVRKIIKASRTTWKRLL